MADERCFYEEAAKHRRIVDLIKNFLASTPASDLAALKARILREAADHIEQKYAKQQDEWIFEQIAEFHRKACRLFAQDLREMAEGK